jgi:hypothetical protein
MARSIIRSVNTVWSRAYADNADADALNISSPDALLSNLLRMW